MLRILNITYHKYGNYNCNCVPELKLYLFIHILNLKIRFDFI